MMRKLIFTLLVVLAALMVSCTESSDSNKAVVQGETFNIFYNQFRKNSKFRIERTIFPIKVTTYYEFGDNPDAKMKIAYLTRAGVVSGKTPLYVDEEIVKQSGYSHSVKEKTENEVFMLVGAEGSEAAVGYLFNKHNGKWYLTEHEDYWG